METTLSNAERRGGQPRRRLSSRLLSAQSPHWPAFLATADHDFYHLPAYVALCAARERGEPQALLVQGGGNSLLLPFIARNIPEGGRDAASPYGYPGPLLKGSREPGFVRAALEEGIRFLQGEGMVSLFVRLHPLLNTEPPVDIGTVVRHADTVTVDLSLPEEVLWRQTRTNHRRNIVGARAQGYIAHMDTGWVHFSLFKRLYAMTMERHAASPFYRFDDAYFDGLREALGERIHLAVAERHGTVVAASLFVETNGIVQYHLSGNDGSGADVHPTKLLMDFARRWAKSRGNRYLHLGGGVGGRHDSLLRFKLGFSPLVKPYWTLRIVIDEPRYGQLVADRDSTLDPAVRDGYFPLYRAEPPDAAAADESG